MSSVEGSAKCPADNKRSNNCHRLRSVSEKRHQMPISEQQYGRLICLLAAPAFGRVSLQTGLVDRWRVAVSVLLLFLYYVTLVLMDTQPLILALLLYLIPGPLLQQWIAFRHRSQWHGSLSIPRGAFTLLLLPFVVCSVNAVHVDNTPSVATWTNRPMRPLNTCSYCR